MKRRTIVLSAALLPALSLLAACGNDDSDPEMMNEDGSEAVSEEGETLNKQNFENTQDSVMLNGALLFGPEDFFLSKIIVLDLGSAKSKEFYEKNVEIIKESYDDSSRGIGIALADFSDLDENAHNHSDEEDHLHSGTFALTAASVAVSVYHSDKELFWDFLTKVYELLNDYTPEDVDLTMLSELAVELGVHESNVISAEDAEMVNEMSEMLVRNMSMTVEGIVNETPTLLDNRKVVSGIEDDTIVIEWLEREF